MTRRHRPDRRRAEDRLRHRRHLRHALAAGRRQHLRLRQRARQVRGGTDGTGPSYINTFQRGPQESVWETIPQPTCDTFKYGGPNGYLDLFTKDASYAKQWKYTNAPDADARAVQAAYWARHLGHGAGQGPPTSRPPSPRPRKMGDYLRYSMFDKYFKKIGNCTSPTTCPAGTGKDSSALPAVLVLRLGRRHRHLGRLGLAHRLQPRRTAATRTRWPPTRCPTPTLKPKSATGAADWATSLSRQLEFYRWLQSDRGRASPVARPTAGQGRYATPPAGTPTFYGMSYDGSRSTTTRRPTSGSASRRGRWSGSPSTTTRPATPRPRPSWTSGSTWALSNTTINADGTYQIPSTLQWTGAARHLERGQPRAPTPACTSPSRTTPTTSAWPAATPRR